MRAKEDVDVLLTRDSLERFKESWLGRGYVNLRPGGKAEPKNASTEAGRFRVLSLPRFVEIKLASGMTAPHRLQDLADVLKLIEVAKLPRDFGLTLDPYVRQKYDELRQTAQRPEDDY